MKQIKEIGTCPNCDCSIFIYKTKNYKRFAKCEICGYSYPLPKRGKIDNSSLICPEKNVPLLIVEKTDTKAYFWSDSPCFTCVRIDECKPVNELVVEFKGLKVYGY